MNFLVSRLPCGCVVAAMVTDKRTAAAEVGEFYMTATRRGLPVIQVPDVGPWQCKPDCHGIEELRKAVPT